MDQLLDSLYREADDAWKAGLINRNDVLKVTLKQSEAKVNRLKLENGIRLSTMSLCQYTGIAFSDSIQLVRYSR